MRYVLDTNILVAALNGDPAVITRLNEVEPFEEAIVPAIALAELRFGASSSRRVAENLARIERMLDRVAFAPVDRLIAERFGDLKADLRRRGVTKSDADLLIAATAHSSAPSWSPTTRIYSTARSASWWSRTGSVRQHSLARATPRCCRMRVSRHRRRDALASD